MSARFTGRFPEPRRETLAAQSQTRPYRSHVLSRQRLAAGHVPHDVQRAAEHLRFALLLTGAVSNSAERLPRASRPPSPAAPSPAAPAKTAESTPPSERRSVKCFSITVAPRATAATAAPTPIVWSDNPTSHSNRARMWGMVFRWALPGDAGYALVHLSRTRSLQPARRAVSTASPSSAMDAMPVDMIIGFPVPATRRMSGRSVFSKLAILYAGTPRPSRNSTAAVVERRGETQHAERAGAIENRAMPFPGRVRRAIQIIQRTGPSRGSPDPRCGTRRHPGRASWCPACRSAASARARRCRGRLDDLQRALQGPVVVARQLRDDEGRLVAAYAPSGDRNPLRGAHATAFRSSSATRSWSASLKPAYIGRLIASR